MTDILRNVSRSEARRLAWHLPQDFLIRPRKEQESDICDGFKLSEVLFIKSM